MDLYAQVGYGASNKIDLGLQRDYIDGAIYSPKDTAKDRLSSKISELRQSFPNAELLFDPQFYISLMTDSPNMNAGHLLEWDYFRGYRKNQLERSQNVRKIIHDTIEEIIPLEVSGIISPNIYISQSLDSIESSIAKTFLREAKEVYHDFGDPRPLYVSLIICREALQDQREFDEFMNDITALDAPPDGIYLIIAGRSPESRSEVYHTDVLANLMFLNLSLTINEMKVINGYSDILTPFLGAVGGAAGATGWWSNLRMFSLNRFFPAKGGGRQPLPRYLSKLLLNRVTVSEMDMISEFCPEIINNLECDEYYNSESQPEPEKIDEILQSWEAIKSLNNDLVSEDIYDNITSIRQAVSAARQAYALIGSQNIRLDSKSNDDHIEPLAEAIERFVGLSGME